MLQKRQMHVHSSSFKVSVVILHCFSELFSLSPSSKTNWLTACEMTAWVGKNTTTNLRIHTSHCDLAWESMMKVKLHCTFISSKSWTGGTLHWYWMALNASLCWVEERAFILLIQMQILSWLWRRNGLLFFCYTSFPQLFPLRLIPLCRLWTFFCLLIYADSCYTILTHPRTLVLGPEGCTMTHGLIPWLTTVCVCML